MKRTTRTLPAPMTERAAITSGFLPVPGSPAVEWLIARGLTDYAQALAFMEARASAIRCH